MTTSAWPRPRRCPGSGSAGWSRATARSRRSSTPTSTYGPAQVHALVGENGAGKSTLIKIISGAETPDAGTDRVRRAAGRLDRHDDAIALGIATVYQEPQLFSELTVAENIFMGREMRRAGRVDWAAQNEQVDKLLEPLGLPAELATRPRRQPLGRHPATGVDRQGVGGQAAVLILDEPIGHPDRRRDRRAVRHHPPTGRRRRRDRSTSRTDSTRSSGSPTR